jgi:predicted acetyltransferase
VAIRPATLADRPVIEQLLELYLYDMAEIYRFPIGADGRYAYDRLDAFWQHPYLLTSGQDLAGLALVIDSCPISGRAPCWFMAEFFVMRPYRRSGLGLAAARDLVAAHPGPWHIGVIEQNQPALAFWTRALADRAATSTLVQHEDDAWHLHAFDA